MKTYITKLVATFFLALLPTSIALAAGVDSFASLVALLMQYVAMLIPFVIALTVLVFLWGIFKLVFSGDSDAAVTEGKKFMTWGIVSLFVMVSVWGLVRIFTATFFGNQLFIPQLRSSYLIELSSVNRV